MINVYVPFIPSELTSEELPPLFKPGDPLCHLVDMLEVELKVELNRHGYIRIKKRGRSFSGELYKDCLRKATELVLRSQGVDTVHARHTGAYSQLRFAIRSALTKEMWRRRKEREAQKKRSKKNGKRKSLADRRKEAVALSADLEARIYAIGGIQEEMLLPNGHTDVKPDKRRRGPNRPKFPEATLVLGLELEKPDDTDTRELPPFVPYDHAKANADLVRHYAAIAEEMRDPKRV